MCQGEICGAVTGGVMALGLKYGQSKGEDINSIIQLMGIKEAEIETTTEKYPRLYF